MTREGRTCPEGMSAEQFEEAQRLYAVTQQAMDDEQWRLCCLMATKQNSQLLGQTEFEIRNRVLRMGAIALEAAVNERRKKGGTQAAASPAASASTTPALSTGGRRRS